MNESLFQSIGKILSIRRPTWKALIEDNLIRILTNQFVISWPIIQEIINTGDYEVEEVITHRELGVVISIRYIGGK